jgi:hypothetical protein
MLIELVCTYRADELSSSCDPVDSETGPDETLDIDVVDPPCHADSDER